MINVKLFGSYAFDRLQHLFADNKAVKPKIESALLLVIDFFDHIVVSKFTHNKH